MKPMFVTRLLLSTLLGCLIAATTFYGCADKNSVAPTEGMTGKMTPSLSKIRPLAWPNPTFGTWGIISGDSVTTCGNNGWKGIIIHLGQSWTRPDYVKSRAANYNLVIGAINRDDIVNSQWTQVQAQIDSAKSIGFDWLYVDDGCSGGGISKAQIDYVAQMAHSSPSRALASAEYNQQDMDQNRSWFDNVNIIMPYKYQVSDGDPTPVTSSNLDAFLTWVHSNFSQTLYPFLGYFHQNGYFYSQLGQYDGGGGYIEVAKKQSSFIFYYAGYGDHSDFNNLSAYLEEFYGM